MSVEPLFILDIRDPASGKQAAIRLPRDTAMLPLHELLRRTLQRTPEDLIEEGSLAPPQANTLFRLQDLIYPVGDDGCLLSDQYAGLVWRYQDDGFALNPEEPPLFDRLPRTTSADVLVLALEADRRGLRYERNWRGFHARRARRYRPMIDQFLADAGADAESDPERFIRAAAAGIWRADFENYSRFLPDGIHLKTGDETLENLALGRGGVCTEKVLALKLVTDSKGLVSRVVFAGPHTTTAPAPLDRLREMLNELDVYDFTYARRYLRYWDHVALEYRLPGGKRLLVDPSNGNIPFLCEPAAPFFASGATRRTVPVRMLSVEEPVAYHRVPASLGLDFLFAWETWVSDMDLLQVFDNRLGLLVSEPFYVMPVMWGSVEKRRVVVERWREYAVEHGLGFGRIPWPEGDAQALSPEEVQTAEEFRSTLPLQAGWCEAAMPGLAERYRRYILTQYGIEKPFGVDLALLDRRRLAQAP